MSLEIALTENSKAVAENSALMRDLIAALNANASGPRFTAEEVAADAPKPAKSTSSSSETATPAPADTAASDQVSAGMKPATEDTSLVDEAPAVEYATVKALILQGVQTVGKPAVLAALAKFDATSGPTLAPEHYAAFVAEMSVTA